MHTALCWLLLCTGAPGSDLKAGTQFVFEGTVAPEGEGAFAKFSFSILVASAESAPAGYWTLQQVGPRGWSWLDQFGTLPAADVQAGPTLLYEHPRGLSEIPIVPLLLRRKQPLSEGLSWNDGRWNLQIADTTSAAGKTFWRVEGRDDYGRSRRLLVEQDRSLVVEVDETVFVGQGNRCKLHYELVSQSTLDAERLRMTIAAFDKLLGLREALGIPPKSRDISWSEERRDLLRTQLPEIEKHVDDGLLTAIIKQAQREAKQENDRASAVAAMRSKLLGNLAPQPKLTDLAGTLMDWSKLKHKVVVLHFWEYQHAPLEEPYGQIAYLDYLWRQRESDELQVYGVAVNALLDDPETRGSAKVSAKKLRSFMNLSYPILADAHGAIRSFGDPRLTGAELPLFVVVGRDGSVVHHHVGNYEVDRDRGLDELAAVIKSALDKRE